MSKLDNETLVVFRNSLLNFCNDLEIMKKINNYEGIALCQGYINKLVSTITKYGHFGEVRSFVKNEHSETYTEIIDNSYAFNQSQTLLKMCKDKNNNDAQTQTSDEDIVMFLTGVQQAEEIEQPLERISSSLDKQQEDLCPFEPDFKTADEHEHYHLVLNNYDTAKQYINVAQSLVYQTGQDSTEVFDIN